MYACHDVYVSYLNKICGILEECCHYLQIYITNCLFCRFHAIYWPAFLMALGLKLPRQILCHSHWLVDGVKVSINNNNDLPE